MLDAVLPDRTEAQLLLACERCGDELVISSLDPLKGQTVRSFTDAHRGHRPLIRIR